MVGSADARRMKENQNYKLRKKEKIYTYYDFVSLIACCKSLLGLKAIIIITYTQTLFKNNLLKLISSAYIRRCNRSTETIRNFKY